MYQHIAFYTVHDKRPLNENKQCQFCETSTDSILTENFIQENRLS